MWRPLFLSLLSVGNWLIFGGLPNNPEGIIRNARVIDAEYDFIIIGAGSAGAVIANRLTEVSDWSVLLVEAGGEEPISAQIPALAAGLQQTDIDWQFETVTQPGRACLAMNNQKCPWPRGKVIGGSSTINYMLYTRGNRRDYDRWAAEGCTGWSYDDVLPYFIKSEDNRNPYLAGTKYHGKGGYLTVESVPHITPIGAAFVQGGVELGYKNRDCNGEFQTGFMFAQGTTRRSSRCSTAKAFLRPVKNRRNLHISMNSYVTKIVINSTTKTATGVTFDRGGKTYNVRASKEVILSGGTVSSPQILMLSGIGPADHLSSIGISPVLADLPVGDNLQDHVAVGGMVFLIDQPYSIIEDRFLNLPVLLNYTAYGGTPLSLFGGVEALAWVNSKYANSSDDWPDIQFHFAAGSDVSDGGTLVRKGHGVTDAVWNEYYAPISNRDSWSVLSNTMRPKSRGTIRLASSNPYDKPIIDPNYFSDPDNYDLNVTIEGIKIALALSNNTELFQKMGSRLYDKPFPGCESEKLWTDEYWACFVKNYSFTLVHTAGTCKMGDVANSTTVVDPELKVKGIKNLRVADTSVMPHVPSGNTNAMAIMIGEKASDLIKNSWGM